MHHRERMPAGHHAADDLLLHAAKGVEAEDGLENRLGIAGHSSRLCLSGPSASSLPQTRFAVKRPLD